MNLLTQCLKKPLRQGSLGGKKCSTNLAVRPVSHCATRTIQVRSATRPGSKSRRAAKGRHPPAGVEATTLLG
jgi:hypothetical protein